jgi:hypothetical protein
MLPPIATPPLLTEPGGDYLGIMRRPALQKS